MKILTRRQLFEETAIAGAAALLLVSAASDTLLGAIYGEASPETAQKLLDEAMK